MEQPPDMHRANLKKAGFSALAHVDEVATAASLSPDALLEGTRLGVYRNWFKKTMELAEYRGEVPPDVPNRITAIRDTGVFAQIKLRVAQNGEVLVMSQTPKRRDMPSRTYALVHWNPNGNLATYTEMERRFKRTTRLIVVLIVTAAAGYVGIMVTLRSMLPEIGPIRDGDSSSYIVYLPVTIIFLAVMAYALTRKEE